MSSLREVKDDLLKDWLLFRENELSSLTCDEDKKHWFYFDEISKKDFKECAWTKEKQLKKLDDNFLITSVIGMRSIIGIGFVLEFGWLVDL